jgi:hypothetical protein
MADPGGSAIVTRRWVRSLLPGASLGREQQAAAEGEEAGDHTERRADLGAGRGQDLRGRLATGDRAVSTVDRAIGTVDRAIGTVDRAIGSVDRAVGTVDRAVVTVVSVTVVVAIGALDADRVGGIDVADVVDVPILGQRCPREDEDRAHDERHERLPHLLPFR